MRGCLVLDVICKLKITNFPKLGQEKDNGYSVSRKVGLGKQFSRIVCLGKTWRFESNRQPFLERAQR